MPAPPLPGFHYDASKRKYFKIQPHHRAPAAGPAHSTASLRKDAETRVAERRRREAANRDRETRVERSRVLGHPLGGKMMGVGMGASWARGLEKGGGRVVRGQWGRDGVFVVDEPGGGVVLSRGEGVGYMKLDCHEGGGEVQGLHVLDSEISSLAISPSRVLMTTAMGGRHPACVHLTRLTEPEERSAPSRREANPRNGSPVNFTSDVSVIIRSQRPATFWASSARPDPTTSDFATATTSGTFMVQEAQASWSVGRTQAFDSDAAASSTSSEVLAVDWLDRNTLLNGCRDGSVRLWDARAVGKGATSWRVRHPSCINHVRAVDVYHIVVAGIENRLCSYDLRFIRPEDGVSGRGVTRPFVSFPTYRNRDLNGIAVGFDVCGDLVAAGTDDQRVQVFDLGSGKELQVGMGGELGRRDLGGPVRCLRFVEGEGKPEGMKLFVATWRGIEEWAW